MVRGTEQEILFRALIDNYHYLGYHQIVGTHLKYKQTIMSSCIEGGMQRQLYWVVTAYCILSLKMLALDSHPSSCFLSTGDEYDWQRLYAHPVVLLETFVDKERFNGTP
jgi:hypothetical protein